MDSKVQMDRSGSTEKTSYDSVTRLDKNCGDMEVKDAISLQSPPSLKLGNSCASLSPITPCSDKESLDLTSNFPSPLTVVTSLHQTAHDSGTNEDDNTPRTPTGDVFDSFAPGPDKLMLAPYCIKHIQKSRTDISRRLNFDPLNKDISENDLNDDTLSETMYETLLDAIILKQAEDVVAEISAPDAPMTPPSAPRLTGVAETCPGAPFKPVWKSRNIDLSLCRVLEYEF